MVVFMVALLSWENTCRITVYDYSSIAAAVDVFLCGMYSSSIQHESWYLPMITSTEYFTAVTVLVVRCFLYLFLQKCILYVRIFPEVPLHLG